MIPVNLPQGEHKKILQFIDDIFTEPKVFHQQVLSSLYRLFGYDKCIFWTTDRSGNIFNPILHNFQDKVIETYLNEYISMDILHPQNISERLHKKRVIYINEIMPSAAYEKTEYYKNFMKPHNYYHELGIYLFEQDKLIGVIGLVRTLNEKGFRKSDVDRLEVLEKYISKLLATNLRSMEQDYELKLYQAHSNQSPIGLIIFDQSLRVHFCNTAAMDYCKNLLVKNERWSSVPEQFIQCYLSSDVNAWQMGYVKTILSNSLNRFTVHIVPSISIKPGTDDKYRYLLYIEPEAICAALGTDTLESNTSLTIRERELADLVSQGFSNQEIAAQLVISLSTVKSHLQNIFKKMDVTSRTELCSKLSKKNIGLIRKY
jgi:DNA-binding CsgD family transcriptional regulator